MTTSNSSSKNGPNTSADRALKAWHDGGIIVVTFASGHEVRFPINHAGIAAALAGVPESRWAESTPIEEVRGFLPTLGDCFVFVMAGHENIHLGQLSAWRRVQGMGRV